MSQQNLQTGDAKIGDEIVVDSGRAGGPPREGEIVDILERGGAIHYVVRWDDNGHEALFFPGSNAHVVRPGRSPR